MESFVSHLYMCASSLKDNDSHEKADGLNWYLVGKFLIKLREPVQKLGKQQTTHVLDVQVG